MADNLLSRFMQSITDPDKILLTAPERKAVRYREAFSEAGRYAQVLAAHGVKPGDRVAVQVQKSMENLFLYLASLRLGAIYLPLNTDYTASEVKYFIEDAEPRVFVGLPNNKESLAGIFGGGDVLTLGSDGASGSLIEEAEKFAPAFENADISMNDLAAILYTSGTTGRSKGAMLTHGNLWSNAQTLMQTWRFTEHDTLLHALPLYHSHGLFVAINICLAANASMILLPRFDADEIFRALPKATVLMGVPTFYTRLLNDARLDRGSTRHMRLFVSGSAPLLAETHRQWRQRTGHAVLERYGMTETNMNTSNPYDGERVPGSVGFPLQGVEVRIVDESGQPLPPGEIGTIEVRGPNVFKGYWRMPDKTKAEFRGDGFFITGDLGTVDKEGYIYIVGRNKDMIITGGFNVYPKEIETLIDEISGVEETAVIGLPHPDFGEGVTAVVIAEPGVNLSEAEIKLALDGKLAKFKTPKRVLFADKLPRNTMGKVQKNLLREQFRDLYR